MRAAGEDIKVDNIDVQANTTLDHGLDNGKVFLNGVQVGSTKDLTDAADINFTFGSSFILKAGTTAIVDIYADAKTSTGAAFVDGDTIAVTIGTGVDNGQGMVSLSSVAVPGSDVTGNTISISSSSMTLAKYSGYVNQTMIAGTSNARLGAFTLSTGSTEGVNVNTITVTLSDNEAATITDLVLKDNATGATIGTAKASPSTSNSFSVNINIGASDTKVIDIYANVKSGANAGTWAANVDGSGTGASTGTSVTFGSSSASTATLQTITLSSAVLTAANGTSPDNVNVIAGTSLVKVGTFDFTAQYSQFTIDQIKVKIPNNAATSVSSVTLKGYGLPTTGATAYLASPTTAQEYATATFSGLTFQIPQNTTKSLDVYVSLNSIQADGDSGKAISAKLAWNDGFQVKDSSGTASTTMNSYADLNSAVTSGKGTIIVRKSIPTISAVALDSSTLVAGSNKAIARVKITADTAGDISWDKIAFTVTKTSTVTLGATSTLAMWSGSNQIAGSFATSTPTAATSITQTAADAWGISSTGGALAFMPTSEQSILAGQSATYEIRGTVVDGATSGTSFVDVSIANAQTTASSTGTAAQVGVKFATIPSLTWSDKSSVATVHSVTTSDWTDDYLVKTLPVTVGTLTATH